MLIKIKKEDNGLGTNTSLPISISLPKEEIEEKPKIVIPTTLKKEEVINKEVIQLPSIKDPPPKLTTVVHNELPVIKQEPVKEINKDSILNTVDTGFDCDYTLYLECPTPVVHRHLCKENFLSEFKSELDKSLARDNLGVYSKEQINNFLKNIYDVDISLFVTKSDVEEMIQDADFVNSTFKYDIDYSIPDNLFNV